MPTLPLFDSSVTTAIGSHRVTAPGGYETWRFAAHDAATETSVSVSFHNGFGCRAYYRRYTRFRARPTRLVPPLPQEYPAISISIYSRGRIAESAVQFQPAERAGPNEWGVQFGSHGFDRDGDRAIHLHAPGVDLVFRPMFSGKPFELFLLPKHCWVLTDGLCDVRGSIDTGREKIVFAGRGFHDQQFGTEPIPGNLLSGYMFLEDKATAFRWTEILSRVTFEADSQPVAADAVPQPERASTVWGLSYPLAIKSKDGLVLAHPIVIKSRPTVAALVYEATWNGEKCTALCETRAPQRLGWSILGQ